MHLSTERLTHGTVDGCTYFSTYASAYPLCEGTGCVRGVICHCWLHTHFVWCNDGISCLSPITAEATVNFPPIETDWQLLSLGTNTAAHLFLSTIPPTPWRQPSWAQDTAAPHALATFPLQREVSRRHKGKGGGMSLMNGRLSTQQEKVNVWPQAQGMGRQGGYTCVV